MSNLTELHRETAAAPCSSKPEPLQLPLPFELPLPTGARALRGSDAAQYLETFKRRRPELERLSGEDLAARIASLWPELQSGSADSQFVLRQFAATAQAWAEVRP